MPVYALAAALEIAGCFAVWSWWRGASALWLIPAALALTGFAWALALTPPTHAGRSFAAYGGGYIATSLVWMWGVEGAAVAAAPPSWAARCSRGGLRRPPPPQAPAHAPNPAPAPAPARTLRQSCHPRRPCF